MTSNYQLNANQYTFSLQKWVDEVIEDKLWEKYVDLHIDVLDAQFKQPGHWVEASMFLLKCLTDIVDKEQYEVLLAIPLLVSKIPTLVEKLQLDSLEQYVGSTPPSFYLFPLHCSVLTETLRSTRQLPLLDNESKWRFYFKEEKEDGEYYMTVFVKP